MRTIVSVITSCILVTTIAAASFSATKVHKSAGKTSKASLIAKGKKLAETKGCVKCHGANLKGKPKMSPGITASGELKHYNAKTFAVVMDNGTTEDGGKVKPPMPVYHMSKADSNALYTYLKTLK